MMNLKKLGFGLLNILLYVFGTQLIIYLMPSFVPNSIILANIYLLIAPFLIFLLLIFLNKDLFKGKFKDFKEHKNEYLSLAMKYYICGVALMIISNLVINMFRSGLPVNEEGNRELLEKLPLYSVVSMVLLAPMSEELSFRGAFKNTFTNKYAYLGITAFLFGFLHVVFNGDFINMIPYAALGFFLGKIYYETDNILVSFSTHAMHNLLCIMLIFIGGAI